MCNFAHSAIFNNSANFVCLALGYHAAEDSISAAVPCAIEGGTGTGEGINEVIEAAGDQSSAVTVNDLTCKLLMTGFPHTGKYKEFSGGAYGTTAHDCAPIFEVIAVETLGSKTVLAEQASFFGEVFGHLGGNFLRQSAAKHERQIVDVGGGVNRLMVIIGNCNETLAVPKLFDH